MVPLNKLQDVGISEGEKEKEKEHGLRLCREV